MKSLLSGPLYKPLSSGPNFKDPLILLPSGHTSVYKTPGKLQSKILDPSVSFLGLMVPHGQFSYLATGLFQYSIMSKSLPLDNKIIHIPLL